MRQLKDMTRLNDNIHLLHKATSSKLGEVVVLSSAQKQRQSREEKKKQTENKTLETDNSKTEISD